MKGGLPMQAVTQYFSTHSAEYWQMVAQHLGISALSLALAVLIAIPTGILSTRFRWLERVSVSLWNTLRIIPSLAVLFLLVPFLGTGVRPAVIALVLLAIPPILVNTILAFQNLPRDVLEAATGMGMSARRLFWTVKVPLAFPTVFAGVRTAAVEIVASATLAAYIGAGGLGEIIFTGLGLMRSDLLWIGGLSVAVLSLLVSGGLDLIDKQVRRYERTK